MAQLAKTGKAAANAIRQGEHALTTVLAFPVGASWCRREHFGRSCVLWSIRWLVTASVFSALLSGQPAISTEPKQGGILHLYHRDSPASPSILEESSNSVNTPFMAIFNNLVLYDQDIPRNSIETIRPELASSWTWNADNTELTFKLREGVRWHDGKPFTVADVKCTWDLLQGNASPKL